jgi:hypothetical protein
MSDANSILRKLARWCIPIMILLAAIVLLTDQPDVWAWR